VDEFRRRKAIERLREARAALARDDVVTASEAFEAGLRLDPRDREGWDQWADCLEQQGKLIEAARVLVEALEHHDGDPSLSLSLVHADIGIGQFARAWRVLDRLRARWPEQRPPLAYQARVLRDIRDYARLRSLLQEALAGPFAGDVELTRLLETCVAWQGEIVEPPPRLASMRELLLLHYGVILLGTGHDDGLAIPWYATYLCSNYDVVATCARLLGFAAHFEWRWSAVAAIDPAAEVLAHILAHALDIGVIAPGDGDPEQVLAVASFVEPGWPERAHGAWAQRCAEAGNMFAFGALDYANHPDPLPPLLGLAAGDRVCLPWWRLGEARLGFARFGLIADLPPEIDSRPAARVAEDYRAPVRELEHGPNLAAALRYVLEQRNVLQPGLRKRSNFARIVPHVEPRPGPLEPLPDALAHGDLAEFLRALGVLERAPERVDAAACALLLERFVSTPEVRPRLADFLYKVAPERFSALLHELVARPAEQVPLRERDTLLHLYGCNPWTGPGGDPSPATVQLQRWLELGEMTNRSEIVQSKYGLHHLAEDSRAAPTTFARLLADEPTIAIGTIRWLHDNPHLHATLAPALLDLLAHPHADVVFEALQCTRVAKLALPPDRLEPLLRGRRHAHPRMIAAAVEHLELWPVERAQPLLIEFLASDQHPIAWAAARSLLRGGTHTRERVAGAKILAERIVELAPRDMTRSLLRALASADAFELFEPTLRASESPSYMKLIAAALARALLELDDVRLLDHLRAYTDVFGLDPPFGYASFFLRHGDPVQDHDAVFGAQGATDSRAGYEAKAVLARWGDEQARAELERSLDYAPPAREAAFELCYRIAWGRDFARLDAARHDGDPELSSRVWTVLTANIAGPHPAPRAWIDELAAYLREHWSREAEWARFIELELRGQIPSKFEVGAQSADFAVLAELLPNHFDDLVARSLGGTPDRMSVDVLEWLARHRPEQARTWAARVLDSPHWGLRQCARRVIVSG
jgi:tetratricopeptide (TPR) repeat protein